MVVRLWRFSEVITSVTPPTHGRKEGCWVNELLFSHLGESCSTYRVKGTMALTKIEIMTRTHKKRAPEANSYSRFKKESVFFGLILPSLLFLPSLRSMNIAVLSQRTVGVAEGRGSSPATLRRCTSAAPRSPRITVNLR